VGRLHELECGEEAGVIISQAGGLVRYRMGDRVQAVGRYGQTPGLRFLGRESVVSDLVGEKLNEAFVRDALHRVLGPETCGVVVPLADRGLPGYVCVTERSPGDAGVVAERVDGELCRAFQYRQARLLGQLDARWCRSQTGAAPRAPVARPRPRGATEAGRGRRGHDRRAVGLFAIAV
jgi:hypothetical protein